MNRDFVTLRSSVTKFSRRRGRGRHARLFILVVFWAGALRAEVGEVEPTPGPAPPRIVVMEPLPLEVEVTAETVPSRVVPMEPLPVGVAIERAASPAAVVEARVREWASTWSEQRVDAYLACYSDDFRPAGGEPLAQWKRRRVERLSEPAFIRVSIADLKVRTKDVDNAHAEFVQAFSSNTYGDVITKRLELVREGGVWQIVSETVVTASAPPAIANRRTSISSP